MDLTKFADDYWSGKDDRADGDRLRYLCSFAPESGSFLVVDGGPGMLVETLHSLGRSDVQLTDLSTVAVRRAEAKGIPVTQVDTDDDPLPFKNDQFDCVISDSALEHRYYPEKGLAECARVLKQDGTLLLLLPNIAHWRHRLQLFTGRLPPVVGGPTDRCHLRYFALPEMRQMAKAAGLEVEKVRGFASLWVKGLYPRVFRAFPLKQIYPWLVRLRPTLFGRDLILVCSKRKG